jgi:hypothetical protein
MSARKRRPFAKSKPCRDAKAPVTALAAAIANWSSTAAG